MVKGKVSAIMPVYNKDKYLDKAIKSVLEQDYEHFNLIIVDDCSTDNALKICKSYEQKYPEIVEVIALDKNRGIGNARNVGIQHADGEYLLMVDCDDIEFRDRMSVCVEVMQNESDIDIVVCDCILINKDDEVFDLPVFTCPDVYKDDKKLFNASLRRPVIGSSFTLMRNIPDIKYTTSPVILDDADLFIRLMYQGHKVRFVNKPLRYWRIHQDNTSSNYNLGINAYKNIPYSDSMLFERLKQDNLSDREIYNTLGIIKVSAEQYEDAKKWLLKASESESTISQEIIYTSFFLSTAYYYCNEYDRCYENLKSIEDYLNEDATLWNNLGVLEYHYENYDLSAEYFDKALSIQPFYIDAKVNKENISKGLIPCKYTKKMLSKYLTPTL